jgi:monothiol glutaredoxin
LLGVLRAADSDWPTIPQVFVKGEFVGGSDTLLEMFKSGDLDKLLDAKGVKRIEEKQ